MKTVGEFREAGYVFSSDDIVDYSVCKDGSDMRPLFGAALHFHISKFDKSLVGSFAWRANTGLVPAFTGLVDAVHGDTTVSGAKIDDLHWVGDVSIDKWRPHLPATETKSTYDVEAHVSDAKTMIKGLKPELFYRANSFPAFEAFEAPDEAGFVSKPVYTKEMHEAGELPPVGSEFAVDVEAEPRDYHIELTCVAHHKDGGAIGESSSKYLHNVTEGFKPIKTEREKLIDEIIGEFHMADQATIGLMFDLWYRKEQVK